MLGVPLMFVFWVSVQVPGVWQSPWTVFVWVLPVLVGGTTVLPSILTAGCVIIVVSTVLAFLSGMDVGRRILTNLVILAAAVVVTYTIGLLTKTLWGVTV